MPWQLALGGALFLLYFGLVWARAREVRRHATAAGALVRAIVPLPGWLRALLAAAALTLGVALELWLRRPWQGALCVVGACALAAHGAARIDPKAARRGPGRWLTVGEREVFAALPRPRGATFDVSTRLGKALLLLLLAGVAAAVWWLARRSLAEALMVGFDAVALVAVFGTGRISALPADLSIEPARLLRKVAARLKKKKTLEGMRVVPRIRVPQGGVDADELRLLIAPRAPLRGFISIEVGVTYALGTGARVAMPEVLVRFLEGSACETALGAVARFGRVTPGRKPEERVIAFAPRLPTAHMTAEIAAALAARVVEQPTKKPRKTKIQVSETVLRDRSSAAHELR
jgi:hypothetical protein